jgi:hypothetical protein
VVHEDELERRVLASAATCDVSAVRIDHPVLRERRRPAASAVLTHLARHIRQAPTGGPSRGW